MATDSRFNSRGGDSRGLAERSTYQPKDDGRMTRSGGAERVDAQTIAKYRRVNQTQRATGKRSAR